ncbi:polysaccharide biosynthesis/export family protein [Mesorhizobium caraganae]|uniref:Polysaccharide biosynthesis/export family protein n=2 Tax=Mesorhizobium caraganae TaxID=483206 RepID=A0ABV1Z1B9_9HYPH
MDHVERSQSTSLHRPFPSVERQPFCSPRRIWDRRPALPSLVSLCLVLLLAVPAWSQSAADDTLGPGDRIELRVWRWTALRDGAVEGLRLNRSFNIDATGGLDLPNIGRVAAAGLRTDELARLIADCLQARSGQAERPDTSVQRVARPAMETTASTTGERAAPEQPVLEQPVPEPPSVSAPSGGSPAPGQGNIDSERGTATASALEPQVSAEVALKAAGVLEQAAQGLLGGHEEEALRRELAAARAELDLMQRNAREKSAKAYASGDEAVRQGKALKEQQQKAEALALDLQVARRVIDGFKAEADAWESEKAAMLRAHQATHASQAAAELAIAEERRKAGLLERQLASSRQTIDALKTAAAEATAGQAGAVKDRQTAEAALKQVGDALAAERRRADAAARDLDLALKERDASRDAAAILGAALEQERERSTGLARTLSAVRKAIDDAKAERRTVGMKRVPNAQRAGAYLGSLPERSLSDRPAPAHKPDKQKVRLQKAPRADLVATIALPASLLPTRPPKLDP